VTKCRQFGERHQSLVVGRPKSADARTRITGQHLGLSTSHSTASGTGARGAHQTPSWISLTSPVRQAIIRARRADLAEPIESRLPSCPRRVAIQQVASDCRPDLAEARAPRVLIPARGVFPESLQLHPLKAVLLARMSVVGRVSVHVSAGQTWPNPRPQRTGDRVFRRRRAADGRQAPSLFPAGARNYSFIDLMICAICDRRTDSTGSTTGPASAAAARGAA
jgi:hypothetical protein